MRNAREKRNYKREQIAERAEISPRFLAAIESGRRKPSLDVLIRLVNAIGASFDEILAPQVNANSEIVDRIRRLVPQCSQRDQELLLALIAKCWIPKRIKLKNDAVGCIARPHCSVRCCTGKLFSLLRGIVIPKFLKGFYTDIVFHPAGIVFRSLEINACGHKLLGKKTMFFINFLGNCPAYIGQVEKVVFIHFNKATITQDCHRMAHAWL